jgi:hypothetical protein
VQQRYDAAAGYRAAGGSWGVVAHLLGLRAGSVVATLAAFERTQPQGRIGSVAAVLAAAGTGVVSSPAGQGSSGVRHTAGDGGNSGGSGGGGGGGGGSGGAPQPSPSPNAPGAVDQVLNTVDQVLSQLPLPTPSPTRTGAPTLPVVPIPLPTVSLPALPKPLP